MSMLCVENEDGYLFSQAIYPTKIKAEDLPEWYMYGRYYKCFGYLSAKGVVDMKYVPSRYSNHFLKDDFLFISYNSMISENPEAMLGGRKTVICEFLGTGMISVMPVPLLSVHPREYSPQGHIRYVPSVCACRWTYPVPPHKPPLQAL